MLLGYLLFVCWWLCIYFGLTSFWCGFWFDLIGWWVGRVVICVGGLLLLQLITCLVGLVLVY